MLTQKDIDIIEDLFDKKFDEKVKNFPTKDVLYKRLDHIAGELETIRTEQRLITHSQKDYKDRISGLEEIHPDGQHAVATAT